MRHFHDDDLQDEETENEILGIKPHHKEKHRPSSDSLKDEDVSLFEGKKKKDKLKDDTINEIEQEYKRIEKKYKKNSHKKGKSQHDINQIEKEFKLLDEEKRKKFHKKRRDRSNDDDDSVKDIEKEYKRLKKKDS
jgi:hypothetical protein